MENINLLVIFILRFLHIVSGITKTPTKICAIAATDIKVIPEKLLPKDLPLSCEVVCYGLYYLDNDKGSAVTDVAALEALANENKIIYVRVSYAEAQKWKDILSSMSNRQPGDSYDTSIGPLIKHLKDHSITGVVLDKVAIFGDCDPKLLALFIKQLKTDVLGLIVCLLVDASQTSSLVNIDLNEVNGVVDLYVIDLMPTTPKCSKDLLDVGRFQKADLVKIIVEDIPKSNMDKTKVMANFLDQATTYDPNNNEYSTATYVEYCDCENFVDAGETPQKVWCVDYMALFTELAQTARDNNLTGLMISYLEYDDYTGTHCKDCGGPFPVANSFLDGFDGKPQRECRLIDGSEAGY